MGSKAQAEKALQSSWRPAVTPDVLTGRKYLVVRAIGDGASESGEAAQKRTIQTFYDAVEEWDPK